MHSESLHKKHGAEARTKEALVQTGTEVADRLRGPDQCTETPAWSSPVLLPRRLWNEAVGWPRCGRRQFAPHWCSNGPEKIGPRRSPRKSMRSARRLFPPGFLLLSWHSRRRPRISQNGILRQKVTNGRASVSSGHQTQRRDR